jgi:hypothetical protein
MSNNFTCNDWKTSQKACYLTQSDTDPNSPVDSNKLNDFVQWVKTDNNTCSLYYRGEDRSPQTFTDPTQCLANATSILDRNNQWICNQRLSDYKKYGGEVNFINCQNYLDYPPPNQVPNQAKQNYMISQNFKSSSNDIVIDVSGYEQLSNTWTVQKPYQL